MIDDQVGPEATMPEAWEGVAAQPGRPILVALGAVTVLGAVLRLIGLDGGLWYDEFVTLVDAVRPPVSQIVTQFPPLAGNDHKLYSLLAHLSISIFGESAWALRLPAFLFGVASIPMLFLLGRDVLPDRESAAAATLLAVFPYHILYSQNARGYSALLFLVLVATWLAVRMVRTNRLGYAAAYGVVAALGAYTHLTMAFIVASHGIIWAVGKLAPRRKRSERRGWRPLLGFALAGGLTLLLYAPLLVQVGEVFGGNHPSRAQGHTLSWMIREAVAALVASSGPVPVALGGSVFAIAGALNVYRRDALSFWLYTLPGPVVAVGVLALQWPLYPRFFLFLLGFALLIVTAGVFTVARAALGGWVSETSRDVRGRQAGLALVGLTTIALSSRLPQIYRFAKQDYTGPIEFLAGNAGSEEVLTVGLAAYPYQRFFRTGWTEVTGPDQLAKARHAGTRPWLVYTFPEYVRAATPELMRRIERDCSTERVFRGTIRGGDLVVCRFATLDRE